MYNFRYLLVTIVSIFVSLAIGLLLGAAITGSDLVRDTSREMLESLMTRLDEQNATNTNLRRQLDDDNLLTTQFVDGWVTERLVGRSICIVSSAAEDDLATAETLRATVARAGGATVLVKVLKEGFGLNAALAGNSSASGNSGNSVSGSSGSSQQSNAQFRVNLERIVSPVRGEDYQITLARALAEEWTYSYAVGAHDAPTAADDVVGSKPATAFQSTIYNHYRLTNYLVEQGVLQITSDYQLLSADPRSELPSEQLKALRVAGSWHLPYASNGLISTLVNAESQPEAEAADVLPPSEISYTADQLGLALVEEYLARGAEQSLPYPAILRQVLAEDSQAAAQTASYFGLVAQSAAQSSAEGAQSAGKTQALADAARDRALPALVSLEGETDTYNLIALLSGAKRGIYGLAGADGRFPALPTDDSGRLPFAR